MKLYLPLLSSLLVLASCTTSYQTGQTPDDVYYSPERQRDEYVRVNEKDNRQYQEQSQTEEEWREDRYLRMKTSYRRYNTLDDYDCYCYTGSNYIRYYDYYRHNNFGYYNNPWNNWGWNNYNPYYYNPYFNKPYYNGYVAGNVRPVYNKPRGGNMNVYGNNSNNSNSNMPRGNEKTYSNGSNGNDNYRGSGTNAGGFLRNIFNNGGSSSGSSSSNSNSNSSSSSSGSSSSSSGSSGSKPAPARKF